MTDETTDDERHDQQRRAAFKYRSIMRRLADDLENIATRLDDEDEREVTRRRLMAWAEALMGAVDAPDLKTIDQHEKTGMLLKHGVTHGYEDERRALDAWIGVDREGVESG